MSDELQEQPEQAEVLDESTLRRRLVGRIALAGVAIIALLGALVVIDNVYVSPKKSVAKIVVAPAVPEASKAGEQIALSPVVASAPEPPKPEAVPSIKSSAAIEESASPSLLLPKASTVATKPTAMAKAVQALEPAHPQAAVAGHVPLPRPLIQGAQPERHFVLQMGVFNNVDNAQELLARLQKGGVPAQIEARVQVGPFKTRKEADDARAKITAMGLDAGLLMAIHH